MPLHATWMPCTRPRSKPKPGRPGGEQQRRVGAGSAAPALAQVGAEGEGAALRGALAQVAAGRVEQLGRIPRHGEGDLQATARCTACRRCCAAGCAGGRGRWARRAARPARRDAPRRRRARSWRGGRSACTPATSNRTLRRRRRGGPRCRACRASRSAGVAIRLEPGRARRGRPRRAAGARRRRARRASPASRRSAPRPSARWPGAGCARQVERRRSCRRGAGARCSIGCSDADVCAGARP